MQRLTRIGIGVAVAVVAVIAIIVIAVVASKSSAKQEYDAEPWKNIRLPDYIRADKYKMHLNISWEDLTYTGTQQVTMNVVDGNHTKYFLIHTKDLTIHKDKTVLMDKDDKTLKLANTFMDTEKNATIKNDFYVVESDKVLGPGVYKMKIYFDGKIQTNRLTGIYKSKYTRKVAKVDGSQEDVEIMQISTDFEPVDARTAFPCFDEPAQKGKWQTDITVVFPEKTVASDYHIISNMPLNEKGEIRNGQHITASFQESVPMSTYLVCLAVSDFSAAKDTYTRADGSKVELQVFARRETEFQNSVQFALKVTKDVLKEYEKFYKVNYPLTKLDQIALPEFNSGAMENWGLVTYRESSLLYNPSTSSQAEKQRVAEVIAHELAHQWFGNLVTMTWWNDLWLNEGFASFVEYYGIHATEPDWKILDFFYADEMTTAMNLDSSPSSHPISVEVESPDDISGLFDTISYRKGSSINFMMQKFMGKNKDGDDNFGTGIEAYLQKHKFGNAVMVELFDALNTAAPQGMNVTEIMLTWTKQMGFPYVDVKLNGDKDFVLTQHRFLNGEKDPKDKSEYDYKWHIPFTYMTKDLAESPITWLTPDKDSVVLPNEGNLKWIKGNAKANYYYIVNYEDAMWGEISKALQAGHIKGTSDKTSLFYDVFNLASIGQAKYSRALDMTRYAKTETEYTVLSIILSEVIYCGNSLNEVDDKTEYDKYQKYVEDMLKPRVTALTWDPKSDDTFTTPKLRDMAIRNYCHAVNNKADVTVVEALKRFDDFVKDATSLNKDILRSVIYPAIWYDDDTGTNFDKLWGIFMASNWEADIRIYLAALARTKVVAKQKKLIEESFKDTAVTGTWRYLYYLNFYGKQYDYSWKVLQDKWDTYAEKYNQTSFTMGYLMKIPSRYDTDAKYKEVKDFFDSKKDTIGTGAKAVKETLAKIKSNIKWKKDNGDVVKNWFGALP